MKPNLKLYIILFITILSLLITGCWDSKDIDKLALVKGIAIDIPQNKDRIKYTVQVIKPTPISQSGGGTAQGSRAAETVSATGYTLYEANRNLIKRIGRAPYFGNSEIIVIGEEIARRGLKPYLDFFLRNKEIRGRSKIVISKNKAAAVFEKPHYLEDITAVGLKSMVDGISISGTIITTELIPFNINILNENIDPVASVVELKQGGPKPQNPQENKKKKNQKNLIFTDGGAMFKGDKLQDWLTRKEARGYNWIKDPSEIRGPIIVKIPSIAEANKISVEITRGNSKIIPQLINSENKFKIKFKVETEGFIIEKMSEDFSLRSQAHIEKLNKRFAQIVKNEIINTLKKSRQYQADIFGFAEAIYKKYPQEFKEIKDNWDQLYLKLPVEYNIKADIRRTGMVK